MMRMFVILAFVLRCLVSNEVQSADKLITLGLEKTTTLRVGEMAVLQIPSDSRHSHFRGNTEGQTLLLVRRSQQRVVYRAVRPGRAVIVIGPDVPKGECVSCATLHYFINVVPQK